MNEGRVCDGTFTDLPLIRPAAPTPPVFKSDGFSWFSYLKEGANVLEAWNERLYTQDIFMSPVGGSRFFYLNDPSLIETVLQDTSGVFVRSRLQQNTIGPILGEGLLSVDSEQWRHQRRVMAPIFKPKSVSEFEVQMREATQRLVKTWRSNPPKRAFDIVPSTSKLTLDFIAKALFGGLPPEMHSVLAANTERGLRRLPFISAGLILNPFKSVNQRLSSFLFAKQIDQLDKIAAFFIERYRADPKGQDESLLGRLITAEEQGGGYIDQDFVRDQIATFLLAGHETTGKALAWTLYLLSLDTPRYEKLMSGLSAKDEKEAEQDPYLSHVIKEALRLYPPAFSLSRDLTQDMKLGDRLVRKGDTVFISPWLIHRNPKLWQEADRFWPERWETEALKGDRRYAYLPFGAGPRICIGAALATSELKIMLSGLLRAFHFELSDAYAVWPKASVTIGPNNGIWMKVRPSSV